MTREITRSPEDAKAFLRKIGVVTAAGRLSKRFGG